MSVQWCWVLRPDAPVRGGPSWSRPHSQAGPGTSHGPDFGAGSHGATAVACGTDPDSDSGRLRLGRPPVLGRAGHCSTGCHWIMGGPPSWQSWHPSRSPDPWGLLYWCQYWLITCRCNIVPTQAGKLEVLLRRPVLQDTVLIVPPYLWSLQVHPAWPILRRTPGVGKLTPNSAQLHLPCATHGRHRDGHCRPRAVQATK